MEIFRFLPVTVRGLFPGRCPTSAGHLSNLSLHLGTSHGVHIQGNLASPCIKPEPFCSLVSLCQRVLTHHIKARRKILPLRAAALGLLGVYQEFWGAVARPECGVWGCDPADVTSSVVLIGAAPPGCAHSGVLPAAIPGGCSSLQLSPCCHFLTGPVDLLP